MRQKRLPQYWIGYYESLGEFADAPVWSLETLVYNFHNITIGLKKVSPT